ncbi:MAG: succinate dehydrogenase, cytochrome b556 subunit [Nitrospirota bacterium]|nr:succinate dehydrogenase, cytochrome b556 subunit [Nitrospirota bacterium]MDH5768594.1 succinate dehydrogenase, cytochrome b556 subunit [Nitrospirota bacterium]
MAWLIHRITGVALTLYIFLHLYVLSHIKDPFQFESLMNLFKNPFVKIGEIGLIGLVIAHSLNGLRLTFIDAGLSTRFQKPMFWTAFATGALILMGAKWSFIGGIH